MKILNKIKNNSIVKNIGWLIFDRFSLLFLQFIVGVKVANHYGSEIYGTYSYAGAIVGFFPIVLEIINGRVIKEYYDENFNKIVSLVTTTRNILSGILLIGVICSYPLFKEGKELYYFLVLLSINSYLSSWTYGIENYFEFKLLSKKMVITNNIIKIFSYLFTYIGIYLNYSIIILPLINICGSFLRIIILKSFYYKEYKEKVKYFIDKRILIKILKESYYLWLGVIAFIIYTQIDKIMIGNYMDKKDVGVYNIALQLSGILAILIGPFQNSIYPKLLELYKRDYKKYKSLYLKVNTIFTQIYIVGVISSIFVVKWLFPYIYSKEYYGAVGCYSILTISIFFKANGALQTGHMTLKKITKKSFYKTFFGLGLNILLNIYLIPKYGINGAAIATAVTQIFVLFILDYFIKDYREHFFIQLRSFNPLNIRR